MLPALNHEGNLPEGLRMATVDEVLARFATLSTRRQWLGEQLHGLLALAQSTGHLARVFVWGSFVTSKEVPDDLDVLLVMDTAFVVEATPPQAQIIAASASLRLSTAAQRRRSASTENRKIFMRLLLSIVHCWDPREEAVGELGNQPCLYWAYGYTIIREQELRYEAHQFDSRLSPG